MKKTKQITAMILALLMCSQLIFVDVTGNVAFAETNSTDMQILAESTEDDFLCQDNGFIKFYAGKNTGGFYIMPSTEALDLTKNPSFSEIIIDGKSYTFGKKGNEQHLPVAAFINEMGTSQITWQVDGYLVTQLMNIVKEEQTENSYAVFIGYEVSTENEEPINVDSYILLDTQFGAEDDEPVIVSGGSEYITNEVRLSNPPSYYRMDENRSGDDVLAFGLMSDSRLTTPSAITLGDFDNLYEGGSEYNPDSDVDFTAPGHNSAVAYHYKNLTASSQQSAMASTLYGFRNLKEKMPVSLFDGEVPTVLRNFTVKYYEDDAYVEDFENNYEPIINGEPGNYNVFDVNDEVIVDFGINPTTDHKYYPKEIKFTYESSNNEVDKDKLHITKEGTGKYEYKAKIADGGISGIDAHVYMIRNANEVVFNYPDPRFELASLSQNIIGDVWNKYDLESNEHSRVPEGARMKAVIKDTVNSGEVIDISICDSLYTDIESTVIRSEDNPDEYYVDFIMPDTYVYIRITMTTDPPIIVPYSVNMELGQLDARLLSMELEKDEYSPGDEVNGTFILKESTSVPAYIPQEMVAINTTLGTPLTVSHSIGTNPTPVTDDPSGKKYAEWKVDFSFTMPEGNVSVGLVTKSTDNMTDEYVNVSYAEGVGNYDVVPIDEYTQTRQKRFKINDPFEVQVSLNNPFFSMQAEMKLSYEEDSETVHIITPYSIEGNIAKFRLTGEEGSCFLSGGNVSVSVDFPKAEGKTVTVTNSEGIKYEINKATQKFVFNEQTYVGVSLESTVPYQGFSVEARVNGKKHTAVVTQNYNQSAYDGTCKLIMGFLMPNDDVEIVITKFPLYNPMRITNVLTDSTQKKDATKIIVTGERLKQIKGEDGLENLNDNNLKTAMQEIYFGKSKDKTKNTKIKLKDVIFKNSGEISFTIPKSELEYSTDTYYVHAGNKEFTVKLVNEQIVETITYGVLGIARSKDTNRHYLVLSDTDQNLKAVVGADALELVAKGAVTYNAAESRYYFKKGNILINGSVNISTSADNQLYAYEKDGSVYIKPVDESKIDVSVPGINIAKDARAEIELLNGTVYSDVFVENPTDSNKNIVIKLSSFIQGMSELQLDYGLGASIEDIKILKNSVVFGGEVKFGAGDLFNFGGLKIERLQFGTSNSSSYSFEGLKANGSVGFDGTLGQLLAIGPNVSADIDTFERKYSFAVNIDFKVVELDGELTLAPINDFLFVNDLRVNINNEPGVPLVPPAPIGYLTGGGGGIKGLADTINGDFDIVPPIKVFVEANFDIIKIFKVKPARFTFGPSEISYSGIPEIGIPGNDIFVLKPFTKFDAGFYIDEKKVPEYNGSSNMVQGHEFTAQAQVELTLIPGYEIFKGGGQIYMKAIKPKDKNLYFKFTGELYCKIQIPEISMGRWWSIGPETLLNVRVAVSEQGVFYYRKILFWDVEVSYRWGESSPKISAFSMGANDSDLSVVEEVLDNNGNIIGEMEYFGNMRLLASSDNIFTMSRGMSLYSADVLSIEDVSGAGTKYKITIPKDMENIIVFTSAHREQMTVTDGEGNVYPLIYSKPIEDRGKPHTSEQLSMPGVNAIDYTMYDEEKNEWVNTIMLSLKPTEKNNTWFIEADDDFACDIIQADPPSELSDVNYDSDSRNITWTLEEAKDNETYTAEIYLSTDNELAGTDRDMGYYIGTADAGSGSYEIDPSMIPDYIPKGDYYVWVYLEGIESGEDSAVGYGGYVAKGGTYKVENSNSPDKLNDFKVENIGNGMLKASWTPVENEKIDYVIHPLDENGNRVYYEIAEDEEPTPIAYDIVGDMRERAAEGFVLTGLTPGKSYNFAIYAYQNYGPDKSDNLKNSKNNAENDEEKSYGYGRIVYSKPSTTGMIDLPAPQPPSLNVSFSKGSLSKSVLGGNILNINGDFDLTVNTDVACDYKISINGEEKFTSDGKTTDTFAIGMEGIYSAALEITVTNEAGDMSTQRFLIQVDDVPPPLFLETKDGVVTSNSSGQFTIKGQTEAGALVTVQGTEINSAYADGEGNFAVTSTVNQNLDASAQGHFVDIIAKDISGNIASSTVLVKRESDSGDSDTDKEEKTEPTPVEEWKEAPFISGYPDGTFRPDNSISRGEITQMLYNLFGSGSTADSSILKGFNDVGSGHWAANVLSWTVENGYLSGYADGAIQPDKSITRGELAIIMKRLIDSKKLLDEADISLPDFSDIDGHWAAGAIAVLSGKGIVQGYPDGTFRPENVVTRAEAVTMISRLLGKSSSFEQNKTFSDVQSSHWAYNAIMNAVNGVK